jgi:hypothetical protein
MVTRRKSAPKVVGGKVQKKNRWDLSPSYYSHSQPWPLVDRKRPGQGRHLLHQADIHRFLKLLPEWVELSKGLNAIVLAPLSDAMGYHSPGVVHICAWEKELWWDDTIPGFVADHHALLQRLGVRTKEEEGRFILQWTVQQARAFQLLHVLIHELGHHHDRMTSRSGRGSRGESFAETYAWTTADVVWDRYCAEFGDPA